MTSPNSSLEEAQAALLARYAPETRVRRIRWSRGETQVLELGNGSPLVCLHGGLDGAYEFVPVLSALAENHRVLAVDRPGHGLADPFDYSGVDLFEHARIFLNDILGEMGLSTVNLLGNSLGGFMSVVFALEAPERISRLVLAGKPVGIKRRVPLPLKPLGLPVIGQLLGRYAFSHATREESRKFWGEIMVAHPERLADRLLDVDVAHQRRNVESMLSLVRCVAAPLSLSLRKELTLGKRWEGLETPTLMLWGECDSWGPPDEAEVLAATNPGIHLVPIPEAGHLPWLDDPDTVVAEINRFLASAGTEGRVRVD